MTHQQIDVREDALWASMADGVQRMLASGRESIRARAHGSAVAFSGSSVADLNMAFAWSDASAFDVLLTHDENFVLVATNAGSAAVATRADELGLTMIPDPLPVWTAPIEALTFLPTQGTCRRAAAADMSSVRNVLSQAYGLDVAELERAFPDSIASDIDVYLAEADGEALAAVMAVREGTFSSLWSGGTVPHARERGIFTQLVSDVIEDQSKNGALYVAGITEAVASGRAVAGLGARHTSDAYVWLKGSSVGELLQ